LHARGEYETDVPNPVPDLAAVTEVSLPAEIANPASQDRLAEVFMTRFWRRRTRLEFPSGTAIELCADTGEVRAGDQSTPICEVELELKRGEVNALYEFAERIADELDVRLNLVGKAESGQRLVHGYQPAPCFAEKVKFAPGDSIEDAFVRILSGSLSQAFANEDVILSGADPEGVHQMRVGLRRFRSCLSVFNRAIPTRVSGRAKRDIAPLLTLLGPARDWDVFLDEQVALMRGAIPGLGYFERIESAARELRDRSYHELRALMNSREYHRLKLRLISWVARREWRAAMSAEEFVALERPLMNFATRSLQRGHRRVRKLGDRIHKRSEEELHELRIAAKKQRYTAEFFASLFPEKRLKPYLRALKRIQSDLGHLNDGATAKKLLAEIERQPGLKEPCLYVLGWTARGLVESRGHLPALWQAFTSHKRFWK